MLITPQYFLTPARCVDSVAVASGQGDREWATWASTTNGGSLGPGGHVDRIFSFGGAPGRNTRGTFDLALGRLKSPIPSDRIEPVTIGTYPPVNGSDVGITGYGDIGTPRCQDQIVDYRFSWPNASRRPTDPGAAVYPWPDQSVLLAISSEGGNRSWVDVTRFREQIFGTIRALEMGFERGVDRFGADIEAVRGLAGVLECRDACERNASCTSFSFLPESGDCFLKGAIPDPIPDDRVISGLPLPTSAFDRPGLDREFTQLALHDGQVGDATRVR